MATKYRRVKHVEPTEETKPVKLVATASIAEVSPLKKAFDEFMSSGVVMADGNLIPLPPDTLHFIERTLKPNLQKFVEAVKQQC